MSYYELVKKVWWIRYSEYHKIYQNPHTKERMVEFVYISPNNIRVSRRFTKNGVLQ